MRRVSDLRVFFTAFLLVYSGLVHGQAKHDLKLGLSNLVLDREYGLAYERVFSKNVGVELGLGLQSSDEMVFDRDIFNPNFVSFSALHLNARLSLNCYLLLHNEPGDGLFVGPFVSVHYLVGLEDGHNERWLQEQSAPLPSFLERGSGTDHVRVGLQLGYKRVIHQRFVIACSIALGYNIYEPRVEEGLTTIAYADLFFQIGYRFGSAAGQL